MRGKRKPERTMGQRLAYKMFLAELFKPYEFDEGCHLSGIYLTFEQANKLMEDLQNAKDNTSY